MGGGIFVAAALTGMISLIQGHESNRNQMIESARFRGQQVFLGSEKHGDIISSKRQLFMEEFESSPFFFPRSKKELVANLERIETIEQAQVTAAGEIAARAQGEEIDTSAEIIADIGSTFLSGLGSSPGLMG